MNNGLFFYFMKVAAGNRLMDFPEHLGPLEDRKGLFVGYHDRSIPEVSPEGDFQGELKDKELQTMARASREALRGRSIACVFTETHLTFWEITGYLGAMPPEEVHRFAGIPYPELSRALAYDTEWQKAEAAAGGGRVDVAAFFPGFHWLPAKLQKKIPRHELLAPVDSLRVHRWLNSGTFRSLHSIKGNGLMGQMSWLKEMEALDHHVVPFNTKEAPYAKLVRRYLTGLLEPSITLALDERQVAELAALWINPAQLETVGALLVLDLGFTLEVGLGKGQDVVDIKASLGHLKGADKKAAIKSVLDRLEGTLMVSMTRAFRERLSENGIFWIQCKAQDLDERAPRSTAQTVGENQVFQGKNPNPDLVLTLMPGAARSAASSIGHLFLSRLMECVAEEPLSFGHLSNWQRVYMEQIRHGLCGPRRVK